MGQIPDSMLATTMTSESNCYHRRQLFLLPHQLLLLRSPVPQPQHIVAFIRFLSLLLLVPPHYTSTTNSTFCNSILPCHHPPHCQHALVVSCHSSSCVAEYQYQSVPILYPITVTILLSYYYSSAISISIKLRLWT